MGRPPLNLMDAEYIEPLLGYLEEGLSLGEACDLIGIAETTARKWVREGQHDLKQERYTNQAQFALDVTRALALAKKQRMDQINAAARNPAFWTAAAWWLERRYPNEFGRQDRMNLTVSGAGALGPTGTNTVLEPHERDTILAVLTRISPEDASLSGDSGPFELGSGSENGSLSIS